ncbi:MAG: cytochrome P450 [Pseudonocardiaceae bacterium]|nr:cytochrome P450 [Pseudonocardiaceae bacterium]
MIDHLRSAVELSRRPHRGLEKLHERFGSVCTLGVWPLRYVFLLGPEANRFVFANSRLFRWREAFEVLVPVGGETALIVSDGADHERRRRLVAPAFARQHVDGYMQMVRATADAAIDSWRPGQVLDLYGELRRVIRRSTIEVLFGSRLAADEPDLGRALQLVLAVIDQPPVRQQVQRLGLPSWRRALAARAAVERRVRAEIDHRRRNPDPDAADVLTLLLGSHDDGSGLTDVEIVDQVISLIAAGYDTTSAAMGWAMYAVLADPEVAERASTGPSGPGWTYLDGVVSETLRLYPPAVVGARHVVEEFGFAGTRVPAGSLLLYSPFVTHRLPELWAQPLRFDPQRWDPGRPGYRRPGPHEFLPFGGGPHRCIGAAFATAEMTVLLERLLARTSLQLQSHDPQPVGLAAMRPRHGPLARVLDVT